MIKKISIVLLLLLRIAAAAPSNVTGIETLIAQMGIDVFGSLIMVGVFLFIVLSAWLALGGYGFENCLLTYYCFFMFSSDAGILPGWTFIIMLIVSGIVAFFAAHKVMNRGG